MSLGPAGAIRVLAPVETPLSVIEQFVARRSAWIQQHTARMAQPAIMRPYESGDTVPYRGGVIPLVIQHTAGRTTRVVSHANGLRVSVPAALLGGNRAESIPRAIERWYRREAEVHIEEAVARWSAVAGALPTRVFVRDQKKRWGSCSADGSLRFNWRLVMAAPDLLDYVVVHELAHLTQRNHSKAFWAEVARIMPGFEKQRARLRETGHEFRL